MKRILATLLAALMLLGMASCVAEGMVGMANPWMETTAEGLMDRLGLQLGVPEGATDVSWRMLDSQQMGEVEFTWYGEHYTARVAPTEAFEDISGLYYDWADEIDCTVGRCNGKCYRAFDGDMTIDLCLWYDDLTGLMYSISVADTDLDGFDIQAGANEVYIPMQTE